MSHTVRAAITQGNGAPLLVDEVELRAPNPDELLVEMRATGLCHTDVSAAHGAWPAPHPGILGHEGAGVVLEAGADVAGVVPGDHVVLHNIPHCGQCGPCHSGRTGFCEDLITMSKQPPAFTWRGEPLGSLSRAASFATHTVIPARQVTVMPKDVPFPSAALIPCGVMTGYGAVTVVAGVRPGSTAVVVGLGSIGMNAVQAAALAGAARIVAVDTNAGKESLARAFGATDFVNPSTVDGPLVKHVRKLLGGWPDYAFECVGIATLLPTVLGLVHPYYGVCVAVGLPPQDQAFTIPVSSLSTGRSLHGTFIGDGNPNRDIPMILEAYRDGRYKLDELVTREHVLDELPEALESLSASGGIRSVVTYSAGAR
jgi:S-(hydroxymethyl)glutathione dehydrogenase/alcohol dehydrogenase